MWRVVWVFACLFLASFVRADYLAVSDVVRGENDTISFVVDDPSVGRIDAKKVELVSSVYAEYAYRDGGLVKLPVASPEAYCAYVGVAQGEKIAGVSLFSCGSRGPLVQLTYENATVVELTRVGTISDTSMEGMYASRVWFTDVKKANFTRSLSESPLSLFLEDADVASASRRRRARSLLEIGDAEVLFFDYVFVSDNKRYLNYGNATAVLADTIAEVLYVNQIYLVGNRFTPQIQFRIEQQVVWEDFPSQISASNVGSGDLDQFGRPEFKPEAEKIFEEFQLWIFETTYFDFTGYLAAGGNNFDDFLVDASSPEYALGNTAHGWHILTGEPVLQYGPEGFITGLANVGTICKGTGHADWRNGCKILYDSVNANPEMTLTWSLVHDGWNGGGNMKCYSSNNVGLTSTVNSPAHDFPGYILAHELGHNLGFDHVYNEGDQAGNVDDCMEGDFAHNGSAILGYSNDDGYVSWSQCSVNKFQQNLAGLTQLGTEGVYGLYSCAETSQQALEATPFIGVPFTAGHPEFMHHVDLESLASDPTPASSTSPASPPPGSPAIPSPPLPPIPEGHLAVAYTVSIDAALGEDQRGVIRQAMRRNGNVYGVA